MKYFLILLAVLLHTSCSQKQETTYSSYGEEITTSESIDLQSFLQKVDTTSQDFKVQGIVQEVCQMKGCWMTLQNEEGANIRITFKDYGFFVPKDISGREVIMEGQARQEIIDEDMARHYAEDGGVEYDESMRESITFIARGVLVADEVEKS